MHTISLTNGWNLTKLAQTHHQDGVKKWLDFGDLDLIFKVTTLNINIQKASLVNAVKSLCAHYLFNQGWNLTKLAQIHHKDGCKK